MFLDLSLIQVISTTTMRNSEASTNSPSDSLQVAVLPCLLFTSSPASLHFWHSVPDLVIHPIFYSSFPTWIVLRPLIIRVWRHWMTWMYRTFFILLGLSTQTTHLRPTHLLTFSLLVLM